MSAPCFDCGRPVLDAVASGPANLGIRTIGDDGPPKKRCRSTLCGRCWLTRGEDAQQSRTAMVARAERSA